MASRRCPGCGASYNGKFCPECYYTPFEAEEIPQPHGRELREIPRIPERRIVNPPSAPKRAPNRRSTRRRGQISGRGMIIAVVSTVIVFMSISLGLVMAATRNVMGDMTEVFMEPEPITVPDNGMLVYDSGGIQLILDWDGGPITGDIPVYLVNDSDRDVIACTGGVSVNGRMCDGVFFYAEARAGTVGMSQFWIDPEELSALGINTIGDIAFQLDLQDDDTYEILNDQEVITLPGEGWEIPAAPDGEIILDTDGIHLRYLGVEKDEYGDIYLWFYAENNTDSTLSLSSGELVINDQDSRHYLGQNFFPNTSAMIFVMLYNAESLDIEDASDVKTVSFLLEGFAEDNWGTPVISENIELNTGND